MDKYYDRGFHSQRHAALIADDEYFWARAEASVELYFSKEEREQRIFEYGCGIGQSIATLPKAAGWDVSAEAREVCRRRGVRVFDEIEAVPRESWDIVLCRHVLEHLEDPLAALRIMRTLIRPGGELYLILPKEQHYSCSLAADLNQHLFCWNFRTINNLLHRAEWSPHANYYVYVLGYRKLLPVRRLLGKRWYLWCARMVGRVKRNGELIIRAWPASSIENVVPS